MTVRVLLSHAMSMPGQAQMSAALQPEGMGRHSSWPLGVKKSVAIPQQSQTCAQYSLALQVSEPQEMDPVAPLSRVWSTRPWSTFWSTCR